MTDDRLPLTAYRLPFTVLLLTVSHLRRNTRKDVGILRESGRSGLGHRHGTREDAREQLVRHGHVHAHLRGSPPAVLRRALRGLLVQSLQEPDDACGCGLETVDSIADTVVV